MAEREGFEPSIGCPIHDFQSCSFNHSDTAPRQVPIVIGLPDPWIDPWARDQQGRPDWPATGSYKSVGTCKLACSWHASASIPGCSVE